MSDETANVETPAGDNATAETTPKTSADDTAKTEEPAKSSRDDREELLKNVTKLRESRRELTAKLEENYKTTEKQAIELSRVETELANVRKDLEFRDLQEETLKSREWASDESREKFKSLVGGFSRDDKFIQRASDALHLATTDKSKTAVTQSKSFEPKQAAAQSKPKTPSDWLEKRMAQGA